MCTETVGAWGWHWNVGHGAVCVCVCVFVEQGRCLLMEVMSKVKHSGPLGAHGVIRALTVTPLHAANQQVVGMASFLACSRSERPTLTAYLYLGPHLCVCVYVRARVRVGGCRVGAGDSISRSRLGPSSSSSPSLTHLSLLQLPTPTL